MATSAALDGDAGAGVAAGVTPRCLEKESKRHLRKSSKRTNLRLEE
jgi:hypothetical protein